MKTRRTLVVWTTVVALISLAITAARGQDSKLFQFDQKPGATTTTAPPPSVPPPIADARAAYDAAVRDAQAQFEKSTAAAREAYAAKVRAALAGQKGNEAKPLQAELDRLATEGQPIAILSARYGGGDKWMDVTDATSRAMKDGGATLALPRELRTFYGKDPYPYYMKYVDCFVGVYGHPVHLIVPDNEQTETVKVSVRE